MVSLPEVGMGGLVTNFLQNGIFGRKNWAHAGAQANFVARPNFYFALKRYIKIASYIKFCL